jgi:hypothetical protein
MEKGNITKTLVHKGYVLNRRDPFGFIYIESREDNRPVPKALEGLVFTTFEIGTRHIEDFNRERP